MQTSPPVTVAVGQPTQLQTPGSSPWASVVISNLSPYLLQILGGTVGGASWLEPFTAMLYPVSSTHAPVVVEAQALAGVTPAPGTGSQVQATWYAPGEEPQGSWPVSLTAQAITTALQGIAAIGAAVITAFSSQAVAATTGGATISWVATAPVQGFRIRIQNNTDSAGVFVNVQNNSEGAEPLIWDQSLPQQGTLQVPVNIPAALGDTVAFTFQSLGAATQNLVVTVIALGTTPATQPTQPGLPVATLPYGGQFTATHTFAGAGNQALLAAPGAGVSYRLHRFLVNSNITADAVGTSTAFLYATTLAGAPDNCAGQLAAEGITASVGAAVTVYLTYDFVSTPNSSGIL